MLINFRQGIINAQVSNDFIQLVDGAVNINVNLDRVDLAFAYGSHDYLFTEAQQVLGAWSGLPSNQTAYLYWDMDLTTGIRTFGFTTVAPSFGNSFPTSPVANQHYFNFTTTKMYVWSGTIWQEKLRVFAGTVQNNAILTPSGLGSQVNLYTQTKLGYILYNSQNKALRVLDAQNIYYFLTTEDEIHTQQDLNNAYKIDALLLDGKAIEPIPAFYAVTWKGPKQLGVASYVDYNNPCIGISVEASGKNEVKQFVTKGFVTNYGNWNFTQAPNTPLFVGATGEITTTVPQTYSLQKIGHIVSPNTIYVNIQEIVLIESTATTVVPSPTPTPSTSAYPTPTPTLSVSPTTSITPSVTASLSPSVTPTQSITPTLTATPTPTITPTLTLTPTPSPIVGVAAQAAITPDSSNYPYLNIGFFVPTLCTGNSNPDTYAGGVSASYVWSYYYDNPTSGAVTASPDALCMPHYTTTDTAQSSSTATFAGQGPVSDNLWQWPIPDISSDDMQLFQYLQEYYQNGMVGYLIFNLTIQGPLGTITTDIILNGNPPS